MRSYAIRRDRRPDPDKRRQLLRRGVNGCEHPKEARGDSPCRAFTATHVAPRATGSRSTHSAGGLKYGFQVPRSAGEAQAACRQRAERGRQRARRLTWRSTGRSEQRENASALDSSSSRPREGAVLADSLVPLSVHDLSQGPLTSCGPTRLVRHRGRSWLPPR